MKTNAILSLIIVFLLLLSGCGQATQTAPPQQSGPSQSSASSEADASATGESSPIATTQAPHETGTTSAPSAPDYTIENAAFSQDQIHIEYPQVRGLGDSDREQAINDYIKNDIWNSQVEEIIQAYKDMEMDISLSVDMSYQVTLRTDALLSISFEGTAYIEGGAHPNNYFYGLTIDLKNGQKLSLSDFTTIDNGLVDKIRANINSIKKFDNDADNKAVIDEALSNLRDGDDHFPVWELRNQKESNFCLTPGALITNVFISHAAGDYVLVEVPGDYTKILKQPALYDDFLCLDSENLIMSFATVSSGKIVSISVSDGEQPYVVYRFGQKDKIELEYKAESPGQFHYSNDALTFSNKNYEYSVYQVYSNDTGKKSFGVKVTELSSGKVTNIQGKNGSLTGNLFFISGNKLVQ